MKFVVCRRNGAKSKEGEIRSLRVPQLIGPVLGLIVWLLAAPAAWAHHEKACSHLPTSGQHPGQVSCNPRQTCLDGPAAAMAQATCGWMSTSATRDRMVSCNPRQTCLDGPAAATAQATCGWMSTSGNRTVQVSCNPKQECLNTFSGLAAAQCNVYTTSGTCPRQQSYNPRQECMDNNPVVVTARNACNVNATSGTCPGGTESYNPRQECMDNNPVVAGARNACNANQTSGMCPGMLAYNPHEECLSKLPKPPHITIHRVEGGAGGGDKTWPELNDMFLVHGTNVGMLGNHVKIQGRRVTMHITVAPGCLPPNCVALAVDTGKFPELYDKEKPVESVRREFHLDGADGHSSARGHFYVVRLPERSERPRGGGGSTSGTTSPPPKGGGQPSGGTGTGSSSQPGSGGQTQASLPDRSAVGRKPCEATAAGASTVIRQEDTFTISFAQDVTVNATYTNLNFQGNGQCSAGGAVYGKNWYIQRVGAPGIGTQVTEAQRNGGKVPLQPGTYKINLSEFETGPGNYSVIYK